MHLRKQYIMHSLLALEQVNYGAKQKYGCVKKTNSNVKFLQKIFGGYEKKTIVGKAILATKKVTYNKRERERPFNIHAVKRLLYCQ